MLFRSAYALMPNHFHLVLAQKADEGISTFMKKLATAYAMYFNIVHEHSGVVFQGRFKSRHISSEPYYRWIFSYVHLNPVDLVEPGWKEQGVRDIPRVKRFIEAYQYASYLDHRGIDRLEGVIVSLNAIPTDIRKTDDLHDMLTAEKQGRFMYSY